MNQKQRDNMAKMFYDLVKVPLTVCCFGAVAAQHAYMLSFIVFGSSFSLLFLYLGDLLDNEP